MDSNCPGQVQPVSAIFEVGSSRPQMVLQSCSQYGRCVFSIDCDCLRLVQLGIVYSQDGGSSESRSQIVASDTWFPFDLISTS